MQCSNRLKNAFISVGAFSTEQNFIHGDPVGVNKWIESEVKAFDKVLTGKGDFCACVGARGVVSLLEKAGCEHAKAIIQPDFSVSATDIKEPSVEATALSGKFYSKVWMNGSRQIANEAIRRNEEESHLASDEARKAIEVAVGTCSSGQVNPTGKWKECLQSLSRDGKSFIHLSCEGTIRGYL
jgi:hypothetical protein